MRNFSKNAEIWTNDPEHKIVTFTIKGRVADLLSSNPVGGWILEHLERDKPETLKAEIYSAILDEFKITSVEGSGKSIHVTQEPLTKEELETLKAKSGYRVTAVFEPKELKLGKIEEKVTVHTDVEKVKEITFPIMGEFLGSIAAFPYWPTKTKPPGMQWIREKLQTDLGEIPADKGGEGWYKLFVSDMPEGVPFEVKDVESSMKSVTAHIKKLPTPAKSTQQRFIVTFEVKPGVPAGAYVQKNSAKVILKTNHPYAPEIKFFVSFHAI